MNMSPHLARVGRTSTRATRVRRDGGGAHSRVRALHVTDRAVNLRGSHLHRLRHRVPSNCGRGRFVSSLGTTTSNTNISVRSIAFSRTAATRIPSRVRKAVGTNQLIRIPIDVATGNDCSTVHNFIRTIRNVGHVTIPRSIACALSGNNSTAGGGIAVGYGV